jgi:hypothetical protein
MGAEFGSSPVRQFPNCGEPHPCGCPRITLQELYLVEAFRDLLLKNIKRVDKTFEDIKISAYIVGPVYRIDIKRSTNV